jgi:CheY-like chemotaxis protein
MLAEMTRGWGLLPATITHPSLAIDLLKRAETQCIPFRLVLIDSIMPERDGFQLAADIRATPAIAGIAIVMLTRFGQQDPAARFRELEITAGVFKPVSEIALFEAVCLAVTETDSPVELNSSLLIPEARSETSSAGRLRVLLAEDNMVNQIVAAGILEAQGHAVEIANNGVEALAAMDRTHFDIVLMDVQMPEMDGFEATRAIREKERGQQRRVPIIALTAHAIVGDRERCLAAGMDGYTVKPLRAEDLFREIERVRVLIPARPSTANAA